eukprot:360057-Chlamydomonas_euryale.AAC.2
MASRHGQCQRRAARGCVWPSGWRRHAGMQAGLPVLYPSGQLRADVAAAASGTCHCDTAALGHGACMHMRVAWRLAHACTSAWCGMAWRLAHACAFAWHGAWRMHAHLRGMALGACMRICVAWRLAHLRGMAWRICVAWRLAHAC